jgi:hypothetical protein
MLSLGNAARIDITELTDPTFKNLRMTTNTNDNGTRIRIVWPSVARTPMLAGLGKMFTKTIVLAPLGWITMALPYFSKILPFIGIRYLLTDKKVMIQRGWTNSISEQVALTEIDEVLLDKESVDDFFRSADIEIINDGKVLMTLTAVPDAESFRHAILAARDAFAPARRKLPFISASSVK